ncbi:MAG: ribokinase [Chloroflexi bacterium]|nr:ribokinase [Chloroflexota bacterium]
MQDEGHVLVIGAAGFDIKGYSYTPPQAGTSNPGRVSSSFGGVGRNIAENLARLEVGVVLLSVVGDDSQGDLIMAHAAAAGVDVTHVLQISDGRSGSYIAIMDDRGDLSVAVSDYDIMQRLDPEYIQQKAALFADASMVVMDLNISAEAVAKIVELCDAHDVPLVVDPTSPARAGKIRPFLDKVYLITPNGAETVPLCDIPDPSQDIALSVQAAKQIVSTGPEIVIVTLGENGVAYANPNEAGHIPARRSEVVDSTGAGDALTAGVIFGLANELSLDEAMRLGVTAASLTLRSRESVVPELTPDLLYEHLIV